jgi:hypothetical protein
MDCASCGLVNPPGATRCDCGYDLTIPAFDLGQGRGQGFDQVFWKWARTLLLLGAGVVPSGVAVARLGWG